MRGAANPPPFSSAGGGDTTVRSPAVMSPVQDYTPVFGKPQPPAQGAPPPISTEELQRRQEELERKERELQRREEELGNSPYNGITLNLNNSYQFIFLSLKTFALIDEDYFIHFLHVCYVHGISV